MTLYSPALSNTGLTGFGRLTMKFLFDLFPLLLFFASFKLYGIYVATGAAIAASVFQVAWVRLKHGRFETMHLVAMAAFIVFGGLTIALQDDTFVKWKPSIVNWVFAVILLGSQLFAKRTALESVLGKQLDLPPPVWRKMNLSWAIFFIVVGMLNVYVAFYYAPELDEATRTEHWVNFKVFGLMGLTLLFSFGQIFFISKYIKTDEDAA